MIAVHPGAGGGLGARRWAASGPEILEATGSQALVAPSAEAMVAAWRRAAEAGSPGLAAAGGDGSFHLLLNLVMDPATDRPRWPCALGAVGLGSSNDAHKPWPRRGEPGWVGGRPVALNLAQAQPVDLLKASWLGEDGQQQVRYAWLNASVGVLAEGNAWYSAAWPQGGLAQGLCRWAKALHPELGMAAAGATALAFSQPIDLRILLEGEAGPWHGGALRHLNLLLSPHVSGSFRYDLPPRAPGQAWLAIAQDGPRWALWRLALALARGRFHGQPGTRHTSCRALRLEGKGPFWLELDGELHRPQALRLEVVPQAVRRMGPGMSPWA